MKHFFLILLLLCSLSTQAQNFGIVASSIQTGSSLILDTYSGSGGAYALFLLKTAYSGPLIEIDNGTTKLDVYGDGAGGLDEAAIVSHCTGGSCSMSKIYDQDGSGRNMVPNGAGTLVYTAGAVVKLNGKPAVDVGGTYLRVNNVALNNIVGSSQSYGIFVGSGDNVVSWEPWATGGAEYGVKMDDGAINFHMNSQAVYTTDATTTISAETQYIIEGLYEDNATTPNMYLDGTLLAHTTSATGTWAPTATVTLESSYIGHYFQLLILWPTNQAANRAGIYTEVSAKF